MFTDKEDEKQRLEQFWGIQWKQISIEEWYKVLTKQDLAFSMVSQKEHYEKSMLASIKDAVMKMILGKNLTEQEGSSIIDMLESKDNDSIMLGLMLMSKKKPDIFKT